MERPPEKEEVADEVLRIAPPVRVRPADEARERAEMPPLNVEVAEDVISKFPEDLILPPVMVNPPLDASPTADTPPANVVVPVPVNEVAPATVNVPVAVKFPVVIELAAVSEPMI